MWIREQKRVVSVVNGHRRRRKATELTLISMVTKTENKGAFQKEFKETKQHCKNNAEDTET